MVFINLFLLFYSSLTFSSPQVLRTKLPAENIRYISVKGDYTIFQNSIGHLNLSSSYYQLRPIIKAKKRTYFSVLSSFNEKYFLISEDQSFFTNHSIMKNKKISLFDKKSNKMSIIGEGINPLFHLNTNWISYYQSGKKVIKFITRNKKKSIEIKVNQNKNPYYIPDHFLLNDEQAYYTDYDINNNEILLMYSVMDKALYTVYQAPQSSSDIESCLIKDKIYVLERGLKSSRPYTNIIFIDPFNKHKKSIIYTSKIKDIGSLKCTPEAIYFIKNIKQMNDENYFHSELAKITVSNNHLNILTNLENITNYSFMGPRVLTNHNGNLYIIEGLSNTINDSIEKEDKK